MQSQGCNSQSIKIYLHVYMWTRPRSTVSHHVPSEREGRRVSNIEHGRIVTCHWRVVSLYFPFRFVQEAIPARQNRMRWGTLRYNPAGKSGKMGKKGEKKDV